MEETTAVNMELQYRTLGRGEVLLLGGTASRETLDCIAAGTEDVVVLVLV